MVFPDDEVSTRSLSPAANLNGYRNWDDSRYRWNEGKPLLSKVDWKCWIKTISMIRFLELNTKNNTNKYPNNTRGKTWDSSGSFRLVRVESPQPSQNCFAKSSAFIILFSSTCTHGSKSGGHLLLATISCCCYFFFSLPLVVIVWAALFGAFPFVDPTLEWIGGSMCSMEHVNWIERRTNGYTVSSGSDYRYTFCS